MNDNWFAGVGAIVLRDNKVLLVRHTYGAAAGMLLNPGGFIKIGELPNDAIIREILEETGVCIEPVGLLSIRCSIKDWYLALLANYISGEPKSDESENNEALFMDCDEALSRPDVTDTAKILLRLALNKKAIPLQDAGKGRIMFTAQC